MPERKRVWRVVCLVLLALSLLGCSDGSREIFETAQLEERQFNPENAERLYRELLEKYPDSPYAEESRARLEELGRP